jgi:hypothetical protein
MEVTDLDGRVFDDPQSKSVFTAIHFGQDSNFERFTFRSKVTTEFVTAMEEPNNTFTLTLGFLDVVEMFRQYLEIGRFENFELLNQALSVVISSVNDLINKGNKQKINFEMHINQFCNEANDFSPYIFFHDSKILLNFVNNLFLYSYTQVNKATSMNSSNNGSIIELDLKHTLIDDEDVVKLRYKIASKEGYSYLIPNNLVLGERNPSRRSFLKDLNTESEGILALKTAWLHMRVRT